MIEIKRLGQLMSTVIALAFPFVAHAQPATQSQTLTSFSITGLNQFNTSMQEGGSFDFYDTSARFSVTQRFNAQWSAGVGLQYDYEKWSWNNPVAFGGQAPWQAIVTPGLTFNLMYSPTPSWHLMLSPSVEWSAETGVGTGGSSTYGAVFSATNTISPDLSLGLGAGVFRQVGENRVFPFVVVNWRLTERLTLKNPLPAGPAGGAGLELAYKFNDDWTIGAGATYRSYRFRLNNDGPYAGGIGENSLIPIFARVSYRLTPVTNIDLYAIASAGGKVQATSADASQTWNSGYSLGFGLGLNIRHRF